MIKTLVLFLIAILLGVFTYYTEELGQINKNRDIKKSRQLYDNQKIDDLIGFETSKVKLIKKNNKFYVYPENILVDNFKLKALFEYLSNINVTRHFSAEEGEKLNNNLIFPNDIYYKFQFKNDVLKFKVGIKIDYSHEFYVKIESQSGDYKIVLAEDSSIEETAVDRDKYRLKPHKYQKLINTLELGQHFFYETHIFKDYYRKGIEPIKLVKISNKRNRDFEVDLKKIETKPKPPSNIKYFPNSFEYFKRDLLSLRAGNLILNYNQSLLKEQVATISLYFEKSKSLIELYKKYGSLNGYFVKKSDSNILYEVSSKVTNLFFSNMQTFWDKRIFAGSKVIGPQLDGSKEELFTLAFPDGESFQLKIPLSKDFLVVNQDELKKSDFYPSNKEFRQLFAFMWRQGDRVSSLDKDDERYLLNHSLKINYGVQEIFVSHIDGELVFLHKNGKFKVKYYVGQTSPISLTKNELFLNR